MTPGGIELFLEFAYDVRSVKTLTRIRTVTLSLISILISAGPVFSQAERVERSRRYTGPGYDVMASLTPDSSGIMLGQPVFVTFTLKNEGSLPFKFLSGGAYRGSVRDNNYIIKAKKIDGGDVEDPYGYSNYGGIGGFMTLNPGQSYSVRLFLPLWCRFKEPGEYRVTGETTYIDVEDRKREQVTVQTSFRLTISPFDASRLPGIIEEFGLWIRSDDYQRRSDGSLALSEIDSELVVPHLSAALIGNSPNRLSAIKGLSRWRSAETRAALVIGLKDVDQTVRREAASSLTKMGFLAEVTTQLMQELSVTGADRAGAIRGLGTTHSEQALPVLLNQLKDQDPSVRTETILALTEIGFKERTIGPMKLLLDDANLGVRIRVIDTLARLGEPLEAQRLSAIIRSIEDNGFTTQLLEQALFVARLSGSEDAARAMIAALDFDDPSLRNRKQASIIGSIAATRNAPKIGREWHFDFNGDGNPSEIADNARTLSELKAWLDSHP